MTRFYGVVAWMMSSLGIALLVSSLLLTPTSTSFGQGSGLQNCPNASGCNNGCSSDGTKQQCFTDGCTNVQGNRSRVGSLGFQGVRERR
jgi:hypothetical protein